MPSDTLNHLVHLKPASQMMFAYGPASFARGPAHKLFTAMRLAVIITHIQFQESSYLAQEEWLTLPFSKKPPSAFQRLLDSMVHVPGLLEGMRMLTTADPDQAIVLGMKLHSTCNRLKHDLETWFEKYAGTWDEVSQSDPEVPLNTIFEFKKYVEAYALLIYWVCCALVHSVWYWVQEASRKNEHLVQAEKASMSIVRSLPWFLRAELGISGRYTVTFPLGVAAKILILKIGHKNEPRFFRAANNDDNVPIEKDWVIMKWLHKVAQSLNMKGLPKDPPTDKVRRV